MKIDRRAIVLMYHRISDEVPDRPLLGVSPKEFERHMRELKREGFVAVALHNLGNAIRRGNTPERCIALTFDDGYVDSLTSAAPILADLEWPGTFFVVTASLLGPQEFWWDTLARAFFSSHPLPEHLSIKINGQHLELRTSTLENRRRAYTVIRDAFFTATYDCRERLAREILKWSGVGAAPHGRARTMTIDELRRLDGINGMNVGSHTENHLLLNHQSSAVRSRELRNSKAFLERALGRTVTTLSYPYGGYDAETVRLAHEAGYDTAVVIGNRSVTRFSNPLLLPRHAVAAGEDLPRRLTGLLPCATPRRHSAIESVA